MLRAGVAAHRHGDRDDSIHGYRAGSQALGNRGDVGHHAHQRTGANIEAKLLLLRYAFDALGVQKVVLKTETLNEQSRRAILALGATEEGVLRRQFLADTGRARDMVYFSVLDDEWPAVRDRLLARLARFE